MPGDRLVRARWRLAEVKAFNDERQLIDEGAISAFYPMALCRPCRVVQLCKSLLHNYVSANGGDGERPLSCKERGEAICLFPALKHGDWPWWFKWVMPGKDTGVIPHWGFRPFSTFHGAAAFFGTYRVEVPSRFVQPVWHGELLTSQEAEPRE